MRLSRTHARWVYGIGAALFASGLGWLWDHYLFAGSAEFGEAHAAFEIWWLRLHGAAAMVGLVALGSLFPGHIARAWRARLNRRSGLSMLCIAGLLVVTGYGLYYAGDEETRPWISMVHWNVGLAAAVGLAVHMLLGKRETQRPCAARSPDGPGEAAASAPSTAPANHRADLDKALRIRRG